MTNDNSIPQDTPSQDDYSKRFWVFLWNDYEPRGGLFDFQNSLEWLEEAESYADVIRDFHDYDRGEIFDIEARKIVSRCEHGSKWKRYV